MKSFYKRAREYYVAWLEVGRNRNRPEFHMMEESRKEFKKALNQCRTNESQEINQFIEEKYRSKKFPEFWKDVRNKRVKNKKSNIIDGKSNAQDIVHIFTSKFLQTEMDDGTDNGEEVALINKIEDIG